MNTKSIIQQIFEAFQLKNTFKIALEKLMDKYTIEDSVFLFKNGTLHEATEGYFEVEKEFDSLNEAISNCNVHTNGIRVTNNSKFTVGSIRKTISECNSEAQVFDLDRLENIR